MVQRYREMADDPLRLGAFRDAIAAEVRAGEVVADIGCGLGTYAVYACRAGASRVYAIDDGPVAEVAREILKVNGCSDRAQVLAGRSTEIDPPERVDVAVFEDYVAGVLTPGIIDVLRDVRSRWLKPGGRFLPARLKVWAACVEARDVRHALDRFAGSQERVVGVDLGPARRRAFASPLPVALRPESLLCAPQPLAELEVVKLEAAQLKGRFEAPATRDGQIHGVLVWFDLWLPPRGWLGTGPCDAPSPWRQLFLPFDAAFPSVEGEAIQLEVELGPLGAAQIWRWRAQAGARTAAAHSLDAQAVGAASLKASRPDRVPTREPELDIDTAICASVDGQKDMAAIASDVRSRWPERFATPDEAQRRVARVLGRYRT